MNVIKLVIAEIKGIPADVMKSGKDVRDALFTPTNPVERFVALLFLGFVFALIAVGMFIPYDWLTSILLVLLVMMFVLIGILRLAYLLTRHLAKLDKPN